MPTKRWMISLVMAPPSSVTKHSFSTSLMALERSVPKWLANNVASALPKRRFWFFAKVMSRSGSLSSRTLSLRNTCPPPFCADFRMLLRPSIFLCL